MKVWRMMSTYGLAKNFQTKVDHYSDFRPSSLSMKQLLNIQENYDPTESYKFMQRELLVRLANMIKEINNMSVYFKGIPSFECIQYTFNKTFNDILNFEQEKYSPNSLRRMIEVQEKALTCNKTVVNDMAHTCLVYKQRKGFSEHFKKKLNFFLDRFYLNRISIRMVVQEHLAAYKNYIKINKNVPSFSYIDKNCDVANVLMQAYNIAKFITEQYYPESPKINLKIKNIDDKDKKATLTYVPTHLRFITTEVLKNSMRALLENKEKTGKVEPIEATIVKAERYITIRLLDKGGGFSHLKSKLVFDYTYSSAEKIQLEDWKCSTGNVPLAGHGHGLPLSRLYARYFDGDIKLCSIENVGTEAFIYLKALSDDADETLPVYNISASTLYTSAQSASQWIYCNHITPVYIGL